MGILARQGHGVKLSSENMSIQAAFGLHFFRSSATLANVIPAEQGIMTNGK
jgi:hypothetical protein